MPEETITKEHTSHIPGLDAEAMPFLGLGLGLTGLALGFRPRLAPLPLALTALTALLYRDPQRTTPQEHNTIFAAADGVILGIDEIYEHRFLHTDCLRISTTLSPLDVPVNRSPVTGTVRYLVFVPGEYRPVADPEAAERNARTYIGIETSWGPVMVTQIAGPLARRIACRVQLGDQIGAGERIGTVRFGARTDLIVQRDSIALLVNAGQRMAAGLTRIAHVVPL